MAQSVIYLNQKPDRRPDALTYFYEKKGYSYLNISKQELGLLHLHIPCELIMEFEISYCRESFRNIEYRTKTSSNFERFGKKPKNLIELWKEILESEKNNPTLIFKGAYIHIHLHKIVVEERYFRKNYEYSIAYCRKGQRYEDYRIGKIDIEDYREKIFSSDYFPSLDDCYEFDEMFNTLELEIRFY